MAQKTYLHIIPEVYLKSFCDPTQPPELPLTVPCTPRERDSEMSTIKNIFCVLAGMVCFYGVVSGLIACVEGFLIGDRALRMAGFSYMVASIVVFRWMVEVDIP
jgi:hypothetical protein